MFLYLSKLIPPLAYPLGLACILIGLSAALRRPAWRRAALLAAFLLLYLGGNRWVALGLARSLEWRYLPQDQPPQADVIVLLAGGTVSAQYPRPGVEINGAGDRVVYTARLYHAGAAPHILLSGGVIDWYAEGDSNSPSDDTAELLELMGVPLSALWFEPDSRNTFESAVACRAFLQPQGIRRVILVTSAWHMPRSVALFERQGFEVIPAPTDYVVSADIWQHLTHPALIDWLQALVPSAGNLELTSRMLKEYLGMFVYRLRGEL